MIRGQSSAPLPAARNRRKVDVAILGARNHYAVPVVLNRAGLLGRLYTDSYVGNKPWLERGLRALPRRLRPGGTERWLGRKSEIPRERVRSFELFGLRYWLAQRRARGAAELVEVFASYAERFNRLVLRTEKPDGEIVYALGNACVEILAWARDNGVKTVVEQIDLPRAVKCDMLREEAERWPGWQPDLADLPHPDPLARREHEEWPLADRVLAPSRLVAKALCDVGVAADKTRVVPYAVDLDAFPSEPRYDRSRTPLRVLYVGEVDLRKGAPYLLHALRLLGSAGFETRMAGRVRIRAEKIAGFADVAQFLGVVPRSEILGLYRWADVLVFPSLGEGLGVVQLEALATGIPVIATREGGEAVRDGRDGFFVPSRNPEAIAEAIERYAVDRALLHEHRETARSGRDRVGLERYGADLLGVLEEL